ncbi:MAG: UDP-N-acetylglucosamine--N-acetylmuramyl-(pentapeptide) pyrophosphoryl-undecaprenol N-acetylglucosamine transferase [Oscillospiraceae bacterium]|jgi:UDP-N-acetylglucosamine--N-acetylmuramyl-(pentapeptide) pyrophosphoryl-undecaprenol N-acetylglucosamine transferase|nr:UDP-N-acetylglucosamine--N-acetylmuramyl-(pentapeptide) pyrophosphoryl-undecaprenol N-acetylglucosamine transferase [Oscillospiraceae bacterium]
MGIRLVFACGGTAGHVNPALAVADEIKRMLPDSKILFIGAGRSIENRLVPAAGYDIVNVRARGLYRSLSPGAVLKNAAALCENAAASAQADRLLREFKPDAVLGTGGYVCYPVLKRAGKLRIPTLIHESNALPGLATRLLTSGADHILTAFPDDGRVYRAPEKVTVVGTPVRGGFSLPPRARTAGGNGRKPRLVSVWGSLGAARMNAIMAEFIAINAGTGAFRHIHSTGGGEAGLMEMLGKLRELGVERLPDEVEVREYIEDMERVMTSADLVICRAGASTLAELAVAGAPALLVPSPYVANNHQEANARRVSSEGAADFIAERDCTARAMYDTARALLADAPALARMSQAMRARAAPDAAKKIAAIIISACRQRPDSP